ncbi:peptide methionine sulfoxide reductase MsrA [Bacillus sp. JCM 19046]|nr:peptide methionine sulfoxide reductase MsrA [Bacillus sp. JCM 19046]
MEIIYFAGGCLWGVQAFMKTVPGVIETEAGRANGTTKTLAGLMTVMRNVLKRSLIRLLSVSSS